ACHRLFDEGGTIGPDLTHANRDRQQLLVSIVDPSAVIRKEYLASNVKTTDGRAFTGIVVEDRQGSIVLLTATNDRVRISREKIDTVEDSSVSLMPEGLLRDLKPQQLRDLFAYLERKEAPCPGRAAARPPSSPSSRRSSSGAAPRRRSGKGARRKRRPAPTRTSSPAWTNRDRCWPTIPTSSNRYARRSASRRQCWSMTTAPTSTCGPGGSATTHAASSRCPTA